jgi:hypothetical protein
MRTTLAVFAIALLFGAANYLLSVWPRIRAMNERLDEIRQVRSRWPHRYPPERDRRGGPIDRARRSA